MRSRILVPAVAVATLLPAGAATAMPVRDPITRHHTAAPAAAPAPAQHDDDGLLGYAIVALGGLAVGTAATVSVRRVAAAA